MRERAKKFGVNGCKSWPFLVRSSLDGLDSWSRRLVRRRHVRTSHARNRDAGQRSDHRAQRRGAPEPAYDLGFIPVAELKVVVQRRAAKEALAGQLEASHLQYHARRFDGEDRSDHQTYERPSAGKRDQS